MIRASISALVVAIAPLVVRAQASPLWPAPAYSVGAAFDSQRQRLVLFGGFTGQYVGDTWEWDGSRWTRFAGSGPSPRNGPSLAYDSARRNIVMFGGDTRSTGSLGDTWVFSGTEWKQAATSGPPARTTHAMVYDSRRNVIVLFGGADGNRMLGDTWEWNGTAWSLRSSEGPAPRTLYGLAYDAARGRTVLFGGTSVLAPDAPNLGDTWEWDGTSWKQLTITGPSARDHIAMEYDAERRAVVLHGGGSNGNEPAETWAFDGTKWTRLTDAGPRRRFARLAYDSHSRTMLMYGGFDQRPSNELWQLKASAWTRIGPP